jgi:hypothetical protein
MQAPQEPDVPVVHKRGPEIAVAGVLALLAVLDIVDSLRVGIGWADDGPQAGYFPFYIGLILLAASGFIGAAELWRRDGRNQVFAERSQITQVFAVFVPTLVYVALIYPFGLYVPSAILIGYFMRRHGHYGWLLTVVVSVLVPVAFFLVFERWFLVPLPKGPLEQWLGF